MRKIAIVWVALASITSFAATEEFDGGPEQVCFNVRDGFPTPFSTINRKVELASGEIYTLVGRIRSKKGQLYFLPSFQEQPWLANAMRKQNPAYPVIDRLGTWSRVDGRENVRVIVRASLETRITRGRAEAQVVLTALSDPRPTATY